MKQRRQSGVILVVVLFMALILSQLAMAFVNFQVGDRRLTRDDINSEKAFYIADSGIQAALAGIARDSYWQGQDRIDLEEWVYQDGQFVCGYRVDSTFRTDGSTIYDVRSVGVVMDRGYTPPRLIAARCVKACIQCATNYNVTSAGYTPPGTGTPAILLRYYDEYQ